MNSSALATNNHAQNDDPTAYNQPQTVLKPSASAEHQEILPPPTNLPSLKTRSGARPEFGVLDQQKGRFMQSHSSINLARNLARKAQLSKTPRLHAYAYNLGIRKEQVAKEQVSIKEVMEFQAVKSYLHRFFETVGALYQIVDELEMVEKCTAYWTTEVPFRSGFEAFVAGTVALGSFFSATPSELEPQLVEHAKQILDASCGLTPVSMSADHASAWIMRTIYLRLTTRPHLAWFASCATMHVIEALGLHVDIALLERTNASSKAQQRRSKQCENIYIISVFLNAFISAEYGRSRVVLQGATPLTLLDNLTEGPRANIQNLAFVLLSIEIPEISSETLDSIFGVLSKVHNEPPPLALVKADVALFLYRKAVNSKGWSGQTLTDFQHHSLLLLIKASLPAGHCMVDKNQPWYNLLSTPFQAFMVLADIESDESLELLPEVISLMAHVEACFGTHLAKEALEVTKWLLSGLSAQKSKQADALLQAAERTLANFRRGSHSSNGVDDSRLQQEPQQLAGSEQAATNLLGPNFDVLRWLDVYGLNASPYSFGDDMFLFDELPNA
ncbi:hypothetical protein H2198_006558 [Neophaeococcomyces mojaviensis]|uniref:Uncharacterized protein n=1 Tax=Neophaeococcomyces mojaviensis TaxID=3383035 RepID=A0ACC3A306_9EURO|nr:hypothetical protein H2198_006558 [Knufia sp. JES_112]